ncbi:MAG: sulfite exporter TauE/SafE family protein [Chloroflexi bacterium]|nr:sulfite exporter TauE/SafE family protein [Chloroflexota bacterium]
MAVQTGELATRIVIHPRAMASFAKKAWRLAVVVLLGVGLWLGLRWMSGAGRPLSPLSTFMADGGGGAMDVRGVYATPEYFRLSRRDPAAMGLDPEQAQIFFVMVELHEHDLGLPTSDTWWEEASLSIDGQGDNRPVKRKVVLISDFHETVALAFQARGDNGELLFPRDEGVLRLDVPNLGDGARSMRWFLPLETGPRQRPSSVPVPLSVLSLLPLLGGLLVAFSPCLVHMGAYYAPLFGAMKEEEVTGRPVRIKTVWAAGLFAMGFTIPYSVAGAAMGYAGQFAKNSSLLGAITQPMSFVAGVMVIYFGLQVSGVFQIPFLTHLKLPMLKPSGSGYLSSGLLGMNLAVGCLGCVGGSLFAGMLLYGGAVGSPLAGGLTLFLFGFAANVPFFLAVMTLGSLQLRQFVPLRITRYVPLVSGVILIALGLLMLSGTEGIVEDALQRVLGINTYGI